MATLRKRALEIVVKLDVKAAVAFLLEREVPLPHVAWSAAEDECNGSAYEWAGSHEDDARYIGPARERLWSSVAAAALNAEPTDAT